MHCEVLKISSKEERTSFLNTNIRKINPHLAISLSLGHDLAISQDNLHWLLDTYRRSIRLRMSLLDIPLPSPVRERAIQEMAQLPQENPGKVLSRIGPEFKALYRASLPPDKRTKLDLIEAASKILPSKITAQLRTIALT